MAHQYATFSSTRDHHLDLDDERVVSLYIPFITPAIIIEYIYVYART